VFYTSSDGTTWSVPVNVSNTTGRSEDPDLALDAAGQLHVAWQEGMPYAPEIFHRFRAGDTWSPTTNVSRNVSYSRYPAIVGDLTGRVIAVWDDHAGRH